MLPNKMDFLPTKPSLEWHVNGSFDNTFIQYDQRAIRDFAPGEFVSLIEIEPATQHIIQMSISNTIWQIPVDGNGRPLKLACTVDINDVTRRLLITAVDNCDPGVKIDENVINLIAYKLAQAILNPLDENRNTVEPVMFSLVPAIAVNRETGEILAYGAGQLVTRNNNDSEVIMVIRGCASDLESRQIIMQSISKVLLP